MVSKERKLDLQSVLPFIGQQLEEAENTYTERDVALYHLAIGACGRDALDPLDLQFVQEMPLEREETGSSLKVLPTFGVLFSADPLRLLPQIPGMQFDPKLLLHAEQELEMKRPFPSHARLRTRTLLTGLEDKGKAALVKLETHSSDAVTGELICINRTGCFLRGAGGFQLGKTLPSAIGSPAAKPLDLPRGNVGATSSAGGGKKKAPFPERPPDFTYDDSIPQTQALLYRLCGDYNPLHSSPAVAADAGFDRPILHGLCTLGYAVRAVMRAYSPSDVARFHSLRARFLLHVFPGETLVTQMWRDGEGSVPPSVTFRCIVKEKGLPVLSGAVNFTPNLTSSL